MGDLTLRCCLDLLHQLEEEVVETGLTAHAPGPSPGPRLHRLLLLPPPLAMVSFQCTVFLQDDMWVKASSASVKQLRQPVSGMQHLMTLPQQTLPLYNSSVAQGLYFVTVLLEKVFFSDQFLRICKPLASILSYITMPTCSSVCQEED